MFGVPLSVVVAWIMGINLDLDLKLLETASLVAAIIITSITLQDGNSHYLKGAILVLAYIVICVCFFVLRKSSEKTFTL
ncbi:Vacuolar cation/proton exchanger 1a [Apostasia shenzhenica]|uniref:Vacuolar cation/proton exchanger 1a n=1 Tax=Apostasia shenzhenica TaxID=1088818 RepID=A0A2I0A706_9ASPA|nr:Vacuolar cation/proton exchanger 1a [Apostasia shenzhenica]